MLQAFASCRWRVHLVPLRGTFGNKPPERLTIVFTLLYTLGELVLGICEVSIEPFDCIVTRQERRKEGI